MRTLKSLSLQLTLLAFVASPLLAACGDNIKAGGDIDGGGDDDPDAEVPDAEVPDAGPPTFSGTVTVLEASVFGVPTLGQGIQVGASFFADAEAVAASYDSSPGSPVGCKVFEYTAAEAADFGRDEGAVEITIDNTAAPAFDVNLPLCTFVPTRGYLCPDVACTADALPGCLTSAGGAVGGVIVGVDDPSNANPAVCVPGLRILQDTVDAPFTFEETDGRYVTFAAAGSAAATGNPFYDGQTLPIVDKPTTDPANTTIVFAHPLATSTCPAPFVLPETATHNTLGGVGPIPAPAFAADGMLANDSHVTVALTPGGDMDIPAFTADFASGVGDAFSFTAEAAPVFGNIPLDGSAFTVGCDATTGCGAGTADGSILSITTTDGPIAGLSPLTMPPPASKRVVVRCAEIGATSIIVTAEAAAYLRQSVTGATRIQATFVRGELSGYTDEVTSVNVVAGHAITTFKTVTECNDGVDNGDTDTLIDFSADTGCTSVNDPSEEPVCSDGLDNDADGDTDFAGDDPDTGCASANDTSEAAGNQCSDGIDNGDTDTLIDFPADTECASASDPSEEPQCSDGIDNDGDLLVDLLDLLGCTDAADDDETD